MPEFVMEGRDHSARQESAFVHGFIEVMFFTCVSPAYTSREWFRKATQKAIEEGTSDGTLPSDCGYTDIAADDLQRIRDFCQKWQNEHKALIEEALEASPDYDETQLGRDFFYTHVGHGVGFHDRDELDDEYKDKLSDAAGYGEIYPYYTRGGKVRIDCMY